MCAFLSFVFLNELICLWKKNLGLITIAFLEEGGKGSALGSRATWILFVLFFFLEKFKLKD
jgi:hypothetical protein